MYIGRQRGFGVLGRTYREKNTTLEDRRQITSKNYQKKKKNVDTL